MTITTIHTLYDEASINQLPVADFFLDARTGTPINVDKEPDDNCLFQGGIHEALFSRGCEHVSVADRSQALAVASVIQDIPADLRN